MKLMGRGRNGDIGMDAGKPSGLVSADFVFCNTIAIGRSNQLALVAIHDLGNSHSERRTHLTRQVHIKLTFASATISSQVSGPE